jgi:hypothetical protein
MQRREFITFLGGAAARAADVHHRRDVMIGYASFDAPKSKSSRCRCLSELFGDPCAPTFLPIVYVSNY